MKLLILFGGVALLGSAAVASASSALMEPGTAATSAGANFHHCTVLAAWDTNGNLYPVSGVQVNEAGTKKKVDKVGKPCLSGGSNCMPAVYTSTGQPLEAKVDCRAE